MYLWLGNLWVGVWEEVLSRTGSPWNLNFLSLHLMDPSMWFMNGWKYFFIYFFFFLVQFYHDQMSPVVLELSGLYLHWVNTRGWPMLWSLYCFDGPGSYCIVINPLKTWWTCLTPSYVIQRPGLPVVWMWVKVWVCVLYESQERVRPRRDRVSWVEEQTGQDVWGKEG